MLRFPLKEKAVESVLEIAPFFEGRHTRMLFHKATISTGGSSLNEASKRGPLMFGHPSMNLDSGIKATLLAVSGA